MESAIPWHRPPGQVCDRGYYINPDGEICNGSLPPYQQNDNIGWIMRAKLEATRQKRLNQMLDELKRGGNLYENEVEPEVKKRQLLQSDRLLH